MRFDPHSGKFILQAHCKVNYEHVVDGMLVDEFAEGVGEVFLTPQQVAELAANKSRAVSTWHHPDGRGLTIGSDADDWKVVWHGRKTGSSEVKLTGSDYREFVSRLRAQGFKPMALATLPPPAPAPAPTRTRPPGPRHYC